MAGATREWVTFADPEEKGRRGRSTSRSCSQLAVHLRRGVPGRARPNRTPELVHGCCSYGAHFTDRKDRDLVVKAARAARPTTSGSSPKIGRKKGIYVKAEQGGAGRERPSGERGS